jgi:acyl-homoserine lactone acylase PvdQ
LTTKKKSITAEEWAFNLRQKYHAPLNFVFAIEGTGEIGYVTTGTFPIRKYNVA